MNHRGLRMAWHLPAVGSSTRWQIAALAGVGVAAMAIAAARAQEAPPPQLANSTLSAVVYMSSAPGPVSDRSLRRVVLQAYLAPDGQALLRRWIGAQDSYSVPAPGRWSLDGDRLCLDASTLAFCARVH